MNLLKFTIQIKKHSAKTFMGKGKIPVYQIRLYEMCSENPNLTKTIYTQCLGKDYLSSFD